jgi:hypothetical protein
MKGLRTRLAWLVFGVALAGCHGDPTSVVVTANTNFSVGDEVDEIVIEVTGAPTDPPGAFYFKIRSRSDLPVVLGLYPSSDPRDQLDIRATAQRCGHVRVDIRMQTAFVPDHVQRLTMDLSSHCHGVSCPSTQLCDNQSGTCADLDGGTIEPDGGCGP